MYLHYDVMANVSRMADSTELKTKLLRFYLAYIYIYISEFVAKCLIVQKSHRNEKKKKKIYIKNTYIAKEQKKWQCEL